MKRLHVNIATSILAIVCFYNLLTIEEIAPGFRVLTEEWARICFDGSLALFAGSILYLFTSALPFHLKRKAYREIYKKSFTRFYDKTKDRLNRIEKIDFANPDFDFKGEFNKIKYADKPNDTARDSVHVILLKISEDKEKLYSDCLPYVSISEDTDTLEEIHNILIDPLFNEFEREYLYKDLEELGQVGIGGLIKDFYERIDTLNRKMS